MEIKRITEPFLEKSDLNCNRLTEDGTNENCFEICVVAIRSLEMSFHNFKMNSLLLFRRSNKKLFNSFGK